MADNIQVTQGTGTTMATDDIAGVQYPRVKVSWDVARATLQGKWVCQKPKNEVMNGVIGYTFEPYNSAWFPQSDING